jgi:hypothetical protein
VTPYTLRRLSSTDRGKVVPSLEKGAGSVTINALAAGVVTESRENKADGCLNRASTIFRSGTLDLEMELSR